MSNVKNKENNELSPTLIITQLIYRKPISSCNNWKCNFQSSFKLCQTELVSFIQYRIDTKKKLNKIENQYFWISVCSLFTHGHQKQVNTLATQATLEAPKHICLNSRKISLTTKQHEMSLCGGAQASYLEPSTSQRNQNIIKTQTWKVKLFLL